MPFVQGQSGNPNGRPSKVEQIRRGTPNTKLRALLKKLEKSLPEAVEKMVELMQADSTPATVQMQAAKTILSEYKEIYQMLEAPAKQKVDEEDDESIPKAPIIDFTNIVPTDAPKAE
jgi:hypothetical protein